MIVSLMIFFMGFFIGIIDNTIEIILAVIAYIGGLTFVISVFICIYNYLKNISIRNKKCVIFKVKRSKVYINVEDMSISYMKTTIKLNEIISVEILNRSKIIEKAGVNEAIL